jgi:alpha-galactosidase/6-phospho-beta-glucosidase family protein
MPIKIDMIGAGSVGFTRRLMYDILSVPELVDTHFVLMDISQRNLDMIYQLSEHDVRANKLPARGEATLDRRAAIADADYIISTIRQAGWKPSRPMWISL